MLKKIVHPVIVDIADVIAIMPMNYRLLHRLPQALRVDVFLQRSQRCLVADDSGSDTENVSSSNCREFDGGIIAHAGGAGGFG